MDGNRNKRQPERFVAGLGVAIVLVAIVVILSRPVPIQIPANTSSDCPASLDQQVATADVILSGRVTMVIPGGSAGAQVIVDPMTFYKGRITTPTLAINALDQAKSSPRGSSGQTDLQFQSDQPPYLLYLRRQSDETYTTRRCYGTRWLDDGPTVAEQQAFIEGLVI